VSRASRENIAELDSLPPLAETLEYESPRRRLPAPFDWSGSVRQLVFSVGVGFLVFGVFDTWGNSRWEENGVVWAGVGAGFIALMLPWPGRIGRKRDGR